MKYIFFVFILLSFGCAKMTGLKVGGDDQLVKGEIDIAKAEMEAEAQVGLVNKKEEITTTTTQGAGSTNNDTQLMKDIIKTQSMANKKLENIIGLMFVLMMLTNFYMLIMIMAANKGRRKDQQIILNKFVDDTIKDSNK